MYSTKMDFLPNRTDMAARIRTHDWDATAIGTISLWPPVLKAFVGLVLNSKLPTCLFWGDEQIFFNNDAYQDILGVNQTSTAFFGFSIDNTGFPEEEDMRAAAVQVMTGGESLLHVEVLCINHRENQRPASFLTYSYTPVNGEFGKAIGVMVTIDDVTEKVEARKKADAAEERARLAAEIADIATWELNLQTHEMIHSKTLSTIFGHHRSVKLSYAMMLEQMDAQDQLNIVDNVFEGAMRTGKYIYEVRIMKRPGEWAWVRSHGKIFPDAHGEPLKMIGSMIDITQERNRQDLLAESEQKFRLLANSMPQLIWTTDPSGDINYFNFSVHEFSGFTKECLYDGGILQMLHPDDREGYLKRWAGAMETGDGFLQEHRLRDKSGEFPWHLINAIAQKDGLGNVQMWVVTSTNIQKQKTFTADLEKQVLGRTAELVEKNSALVAMNIELQSFAYVSSHDLQEPLRKIQMFISRLYDSNSSAFTEDDNGYLAKIDFAAKRMQTLILDLLSYSKASSSDRVFVGVNLKDLANEVITDLKDVADRRQAVIELDGLCETKVIPFQFRQLFNNLIGNALKFSRPEVAPHIRITSRIVKESAFKEHSKDLDKKYCHICISDNGIGFDAQYEKQIFQVFKRLHGTAEYLGTGIGLAIVKKIVENHYGYINATGNIGVGARFDIYIPQF